jgi:hypothetical protein
LLFWSLPRPQNHQLAPSPKTLYCLASSALLSTKQTVASRRNCPTHNFELTLWCAGAGRLHSTATDAALGSPYF